ncbi:MAG: hypothetical protein ACK5MV_12970 [Aminipila sp.]
MSSTLVLLNTELEEDLKELQPYLQTENLRMNINGRETRSYVTSNGNAYEVEVATYLSDELGNLLPTTRGKKYTVSVGDKLTTTYTFNFSKPLGGKIVTKTTYTIDRINRGWVVGMTGTRATISVTPPQWYGVDSKEFDFTLDFGYDIKAEGYVTLKASANINLYLNYYPVIWVYGIGTNTNEIWANTYMD